MEKAGQQMEAEQRLIGLMHHSKLIFKDLTSVAAQLMMIRTEAFNDVILLNIGGIQRNFGNCTLPKKQNMKMREKITCITIIVLIDLDTHILPKSAFTKIQNIWPLELVTIYNL